MKDMKMHQITALVFAFILAVAAIITGQLEPKTKASQNKDHQTTQAEPSTPEPFLQDAQTVSREHLQVIDAPDITKQVNDFFTLFNQSLEANKSQQTATLAKQYLSKVLQENISDQPDKTASDLARTVGLLTKPQNITVLRTEQINSDIINVVIEVTMSPDQKIEKNIELINENQSWKINSFQIIE